LISATSVSSEWEDALSLREWWLICDGAEFHDEVKAVVGWELRDSWAMFAQGFFGTPLGYLGKTGESSSGGSGEGAEVVSSNNPGRWALQVVDPLVDHAHTESSRQAHFLGPTRGEYDGKSYRVFTSRNYFHQRSFLSKTRQDRCSHAEAPSKQNNYPEIRGKIS